MKLKTLYVLKSDFISTYKEFFNSRCLKSFLENVNFLSPHIMSKFNSLPEIQLGTRRYIKLNGELLKSDIKWGPRILVGLSVRTDSKGRIFAVVPMDSLEKSEYSSFVYREYKEIRFYKGMADAIFDINNLCQIWPKREINQNEFIKYLTKIEKLKKQENKIRGY